MSTIGSGIAASAAQAMVQTNQSAKSADAARNRDESLAKKMRDLLEQHTHEVENSSQADGQKSRIHDEEHDHTSRRRRNRQATDYFEQSQQDAGQEAASQEQDRSPAEPPAQSKSRQPSPDPPIHRLDITA